MGIKITNITLDKEKYLYWIDKNINLSFKLETDHSDQEVEEVYINYWFNIICDWKKKVKANNRISIAKDIILNIEKQYNISIPIIIPNSKWNYSKIKNFIYIKLDIPYLKKKVDVKVSFSPEEYNKLGIKKVISYKNYKFNDLFVDDDEKNINSTLSLKSENKILLKTKFEWLLFDFQDEDYINIEILNKLKKNSFKIRFIYFLLNSKIYRTVYKYIILIPIFFFIFILILPLIKNFSIIYSFPLNDIIWNWLVISFLLCILIILFSKIIEKVYQSSLYKNVYNIKFNSFNDISNNINNKLKSWRLNIYDIFQTFDIERINIPFDYKFSLRLDSYLESFEWTWRDVKKVTDKLYWIELFNEQWNKVFDVNNIKLVNNDYSKINDILLPVLNEWWIEWVTKIYYKLSIDFKSSYLPNYKNTLSVNINKKLINDNKDYSKIFKRVVISIIIFWFFVYIFSLFNWNIII